MTTVPLAVYAMDDIRAPELQLHVQPGAGAYCVLFGWDAAPPLIDGGPPPILEEVFAAALVRCGTVAFLAEPTRSSRSVLRQGWSLVDEDHWTRLASTPVDWLLRRRLPWIMATRDLERARGLFTEMSWPQQHQVGFVLREGRLPSLTRRLVSDVLSAKDASIGVLGLPEEVLALALPAVDGDYLELVAREQSTREDVRAAVAAECERRGLPFGSRGIHP